MTPEAAAARAQEIVKACHARPHGDRTIVAACLECIAAALGSPRGAHPNSALQLIRDCPHRDAWICCWTCAKQAIEAAAGADGSRAAYPEGVTAEQIEAALRNVPCGRWAFVPDYEAMAAAVAALLARYRLEGTRPEHLNPSRPTAGESA